MLVDIPQPVEDEADIAVPLSLLRSANGVLPRSSADRLSRSANPSAERAAGRRSESNALSGGAAGREHLSNWPRSPVSASYHGAMARTDTASRVIAAPPDRVFAALVDPEALTAWLPPDGMSGRFERFDARPGGSYRLVLTYADASSARGKATADSDIVEARFVDIVPGVRVVQAVDFVSDDPTHAGTMTMTWEVTALDAGTRVDIRADGVPAGISAKDHAAGLASSLANLATYLEQ